MSYKPGDYIVNRNKPEWGPGKVLEAKGSLVTVYFRDCDTRPVRRIDTNYAQLEPAGIDSDVVLDNLPSSDPNSPALQQKRVTREDGIETFRRYYPLLFEDPKYIGDAHNGERAYKVLAHEIYHQQLGEGQGRDLLAKEDFDGLFARLFAVETKLNLLSAYEKMALDAALRDEGAAKRYFTALFDVVESDHVEQESFERLIRAVDELPHEEGRARVATWPVLTEFPFIARPDVHMFLKPGVTKACADRIKFELSYVPALNWTTYSRLITMTQHLFEELKAYGARDHIDVQSYIWVIAMY